MGDLSDWFREASRRKRWLVGVSGGADSVALVELLVEEGFRNLVVCHLDHRLRGRASAADARWVGKLAQRLGLAAEIGREDVAERMRRSGESMETAARAARHRFFAGCARKWRCRRLLLAHHAEDQAETVLWNLLRGSHGARGMEQGPRTIRMDTLAIAVERPLLGCRRAWLREWLATRGLDWREDASNSAPVAVRNRLRHEVLPLLAEISGRDPVEMLCRAAEADAALRGISRWAVEQAAAVDPQGRLHAPVLRGLPQALAEAVVADYLARGGVTGPGREGIARCLSLLDDGGPAVANLPGGRRLRRRAGRLFLE